MLANSRYFLPDTGNTFRVGGLEIKLNPAVQYWSNYFFDVNAAEKQGQCSKINTSLGFCGDHVK